MKNLGSTFLIILLVTIGYLPIGSWYWACRVQGLCGDEATTSSQTAKQETAPSQPLAFSQAFELMDRGTPVFKAKNGVRFGKRSDQPVYGQDIKDRMDELVDYLQANENKDLIITGIYGDADSTPTHSPYSNFGLARAHKIQDILVAEGIAASRIITFYDKEDHPHLFNELDTLEGGISLELVTREADGEGPDNPFVEPFKVHFGSGDFYVELDSTLRDKVSHAIQYLRIVEGSNLSLTGHTDGVGSDETNLRLGQQRADELAKIFMDFGLNQEKISTSSKGKTEPIGDNSTKDGKALNRRVEMVISN